MSERERARQSPLRDLMLELHQSGIEVKFCKGRPGWEAADVFAVNLPAGLSLEESCSILARIYRAINESAESSPPRLLSYKTAASFVEQVQELKRDFNEDQRDTSFRPSGDGEDDVHLETDNDGGGTVRASVDPSGELHQGGSQGTDQPRSGHSGRSNRNATRPLLPFIGQASTGGGKGA